MVYTKIPQQVLGTPEGQTAGIDRDVGTLETPFKQVRDNDISVPTGQDIAYGSTIKATFGGFVTDWTGLRNVPSNIIIYQIRFPNQYRARQIGLAVKRFGQYDEIHNLDTNDSMIIKPILATRDAKIDGYEIVQAYLNNFTNSYASQGFGGSTEMKYVSSGFSHTNQEVIYFGNQVNSQDTVSDNGPIYFRVFEPNPVHLYFKNSGPEFREADPSKAVTFYYVTL